MKYIYLSAIIIVAISFLSGSQREPFSRNNIESENESPADPYEEFMLQRTYPNELFNIKAYKNALIDAASRTSQQRISAQKSWTLEGPGNIGGRFNCIAVNPLFSEVMYAGSANGGVWKTNDNAATWFPVFDAIEFLAIGAIAINPNDTNDIWVGTGDLNISGTMYTGNGVYRSINGGVAWNYLGLGDTYITSAIIFNPDNSNEVLVGTMGNSFNKDNKRGVYKTVDGGTTFTQVKYLNDSTGIIDMVQNPDTPSVVYASSFTRVRNNRSSTINGTENYLFKSIDFGTTWNVLFNGLPNGAVHERLGVGICKSQPNIIYALYSTSDLSEPQLYKSTNSGADWIPIIMGTWDKYSYGGFGWYFGKIYVDPNNPNTLYIPGVFLQYSTDGGINWYAATSFNVHADGHFLHFNSSNDIIFCTDGGMYRSTGGLVWNDIENIPNNQFYSITENQNNVGEYAGGVQDNGTMYGNASGINNFVKIYGGDGFTVTYPHNTSLVYTETQNGNIVYDDSFPSGNFYGVITNFNEYYNWHTPYFLAHGGDDTLFLGGQTVQRVDGAPYGTAVSISPILHDLASSQRVSNISSLNQSWINGGIIYAGTADGKVWNTLDYGLTWNDITPFQSSSFYVTRVMPSPNDETTAYVTRSGYRDNDKTPLIFKTVDYGNNWTDISGDLPMLAVNDIEIYPGDENIIFIGNDAGVYYTDNGGTHWERLGDKMPFVAVLDLQLNFDKTRIIAGTFGRSMYSIDVTDIITTISSIDSKVDISVYPNPAVDYIIIKSNSRNHQMNIYNNLGKLVLRGAEGTVDVKNLPAGNYFISVDNGDKRIVKRFLKI